MSYDFFRIVFKIDNLIKQCSPDTINIIGEYIKQYNGIDKYVFRSPSLGNSKDTLFWLSKLKEKGYFNPVNNPNTNEDPHWYILDYLQIVANNNLKKPDQKITSILVKIVNSIINYKGDNGKRIDNYRTDLIMLRMFRIFPKNQINKKHIGFVEEAKK